MVKRLFVGVFCVCLLTVTCFAAPVITQQPQDVYFPAGTEVGSPSWSVVAEGEGSLSYQWQYSANGGSTWYNINTNANGPVYTAGYMANNPSLFERDVNGGRYYRVIVTDTNGSTVSGTVTSRIAGFYLLGSLPQLLSFASDIGNNILITVGDAAQKIVGTNLLVLSLGFFFLGGIIGLIGRMLRRS